LADQLGTSYDYKTPILPATGDGDFTSIRDTIGIQGRCEFLIEFSPLAELDSGKPFLAV